MLIFNIAIDIIAIAIAFLILIMRRHDGGNMREKKLFYLLTFVLIATLSVDALAWLIDGKTFWGAIIVSYFLNSVFYLLQIVYCWMWLLFSDIWNTENFESALHRSKWYAIPMIAEICMILINPFTGYVFTIDENIIYSRGSLYLINLIPYLFYIIYALIISVISAIFSKSEARKKHSIFFAACMTLPLCGFIIEAFVFGVNWIWPFISISLLMIFMYRQQTAIAEERHQKDEAHLRLAEKEREATQARVDIMKSQMQPHFIYNTLSTIKILCLRDPDKARDVIDRLSIFLRTNMDSLAMKAPVPFLQELEHTKAYASIEMIRYEDVNVVYDIKETDFELPALTIQPMVENAIKHGLHGKKKGTVFISSYKENNSFYVTITDNGVGFDPTTEPDKSRNHIGLQNTKERLAYMLGATLDVSSKLGVGTCIKITIPGGNIDESNLH